MTEAATPSKSDTVTVHLSRPISFNEASISSLTFREATAGDACLADAVSGPFTKLLAILSGMCGQPLPMLKLVPMKDLSRIFEATEPLMGEASAVVGLT